MAKKLFKYQQVVKYRKEHPEATVAEIAKALNVNLQYAYKALSEGKPSRRKKALKPVTFTVAESAYAVQQPIDQLAYLNRQLDIERAQVAKLNHIIQYLEQRLGEHHGVTV